MNDPRVLRPHFGYWRPTSFSVRLYAVECLAYAFAVLPVVVIWALFGGLPVTVLSFAWAWFVAYPFGVEVRKAIEHG